MNLSVRIAFCLQVLVDLEMYTRVSLDSAPNLVRPPGPLGK